MHQAAGVSPAPDILAPAGTELPAPTHSSTLILRSRKAATEWRRWLPAVLVLAVALGLRLWHIDLTQFDDDQALLSKYAAQMLDTHQLALWSGMSFTILVRIPALITYVLAIPMLVSRDPVVISAFVACLDAIAAILLYRTAELLAGRLAAAGAGLAYAVMPAALLFGRKIYNPDLVPFFCALAMLALVDAWQRRRGSSLAVALIAIACSIEVHFATAPLLVLWIAVALAHRRQALRLRPILLGMGISALTIAPYVYLQASTGWADLWAGLAYLREPKFFDLQAVHTAANLLSGDTVWQQLLPPSPLAPRFTPTLWGVLALVLPAGGLVLSFRWWREGGWIPVAFAIVPVLGTLQHVVGLLPTYLLAILPAAAVLTGLALAAVPWKPAGWLALAALAICDVSSWLRFDAAVAENPPGAAYGVPLRYWREASELANTLPGTIYVANSGDRTAIVPFILGYKRDVKDSDSRTSLVLPSTASAYIVQADGGPAEAYAQAHFGTPAGQAATPAGHPVFRVYRLDGTASPTLDQSLAVDLGHALEITGFSASTIESGQPSRVAFTWRVIDVPVGLPSDLEQFAHLVDSGGRVWSTDEDTRGYRRSEWLIGDRVLTWFDLSPQTIAPTGGYWLETGFYEPVSVRNLPVYSATGATSNSVRLGPVRLGGSNPPAAAPPLAIFGNGELALMSVSHSGQDVTLAWRALTKPAGDYTVFVHALSSSGTVAGQHDGQPQNGSFPTSLWQAGDVVTDVHHLDGPIGAAASVEIGLYTRPDIRRLTAAGPDGQSLGDNLTLTIPAG